MYLRKAGKKHVAATSLSIGIFYNLRFACDAREKSLSADVP